jgi:transporter family-2 protein
MRLDLYCIPYCNSIAFQARANGELSHLLGNSIQAATVSFSSGLIIISLVAAKHHGMKQGLAGIKRGITDGGLKRWNLFAGMLGGIFVSIQTNTVPIIGVAVYSVASISGQTASSLIVDSMGLAGGAKKHITFRRILASLLTVIAVLVSVWGSNRCTRFIFSAGGTRRNRRWHCRNSACAQRQNQYLFWPTLDYFTT